MDDDNKSILQKLVTCKALPSRLTSSKAPSSFTLKIIENHQNDLEGQVNNNTSNSVVSNKVLILSKMLIKVFLYPPLKTFNKNRNKI